MPSLIHTIRSVWVPVEVKKPSDAEGNICNDLPRFLHPEECKDFLQINARRLSKRLIRYEERFEESFRQEFARGVGRDGKPPWRYGPVYGPEVPKERRSLRDYD